MTERNDIKMKNDKGITLTSLIIYVIGMAIAVATITTLISYFSKNVKIETMGDSTAEYTKFTSIFTEETNQTGNTIIECKTEGEGKSKVSYIIFSTR